MAEDCMEVEEQNPETAEKNDSNNDTKDEQIIHYLIQSKDAYFKSQQRGEEEISNEEKREIVTKIFTTSKSTFLCRFGKHLKEEHLEYFNQFLTDENDGYAVGYYLSDLKRYFTKSKREKDIKNRRYDALKKLVESGNYFTETEMMKRNPLLYEQLVGRYLSEDEKKKRDNIDTKNITFVNLLLESIDRDATRRKQKEQEDFENEDVEEDSLDSNSTDKKDETKNNIESDSWDDEIPDNTVKWGEIPATSSEVSIPQPTRRYDFLNLFDQKTPIPQEVVMITATERRLLKEEFISIMYQNFLDGKDQDFDYTTVDDNDEYDNLDIKTHDAEDSYFDSETPEDALPEPAIENNMATGSETSEDELDVFMNRLGKHHAVQKLSDNMNKL